MSLDFFKEEIARGVEIAKHHLRQAGSNANGPDASRLRSFTESEIASHVWDLEECEFGLLGSKLNFAMGYALLTMPMTDWETFYDGYSEWAKTLPKCVFKGSEEENARGGMLMALKAHCPSEYSAVGAKVA